MTICLVTNRIMNIIHPAGVSNRLTCRYDSQASAKGE